MTKTHRKAAATAEDAFNRHYAAIWGEERWLNSLYPALLRPTRYVCLLNRYASLVEGARRTMIDQAQTQPLSLPRFNCVKESRATNIDYESNCFVRHIEIGDEASGNEVSPAFPPPAVSSTRLATHWNLDAASVLAAHLLDVQPGDNVLDLCAAPGGKSIAISQRLWPHLHDDDSLLNRKVSEAKTLRLSNMHSNEADGTRQRRLAENLRAYLPKSLFDKNQIIASRIDGAKPKAEYELRVKTPTGTVGFDKVLIDAPCSSERHIIHANAKAVSAGRVADEMANWRPGSSKRLASTQIDLLMTGLKAAKVGGAVLYATCSIDPIENDGVIEKVLAQVEKERKKRGLRWTVAVGFGMGKGDHSLEADLDQNWAERTKHGWIALPDHPAGGRWGPLFFAMLNKVDAPP